IGTGSGLVRVPKVCGGTVAAADAALRGAGLTMVVTPAPPASTTALLAASGCQLPEANGQKGKVGTPVTVILAPVTTTSTGTAAATTTRKSGGGNALPVVKGLAAAAGVAALAKRGRTFGFVRTLSGEKPGTVLGVDGTPGPNEPVPLLVSTGAPSLVYDDGTNL